VVNANGFYLMGSTGKINVPGADQIEQQDLLITKSGDILLGKTTVGRVRVVEFQQKQEMLKTAGTMFTSKENPKDVHLSDESTTIRQGYLEESNVEALTEMVQLVELTRGFETDQRTMRYQDSTLEKAMDVGRV
jgi:flagellar basal-body rod protein FlgF